MWRIDRTPPQFERTIMPEPSESYEFADDLTEEDEEILDKIWAEIAAEDALEEQGLGKPRWNLKIARKNRPDLKQPELKEWMQIANEEYRRLRMKKVADSTATQKAEKKANQKIPKAK